MNKFERTKVASALSCAFGVGSAVLLFSGVTSAQTPVGTIDKREITGSNIKKTDTETASPIQVITRQDIDASGLNTISDVVRQITANSNGTIADANINGFGAGASGVSLRGLGVNNTLVLLNGRRLAVYGLADDGQRSFVDLNQVPMDIVERIEVLKQGASAVYGSDAVAGVVNIITRQQFTGGAINAEGGTTYKNDGNTYRGSLTLGTGDLTRERYNAFITFDGQHQEAIKTTTRRSYIGSLNLTNVANAGVDERPGTLPVNPNSLSSSSTVGNVRPILNGDPNSVGPYQSLPGCKPANLVDGFCAWDYKDYQNIQPKTERLNVFARGAYNFTDTTQVYTELSWFQSKVSALSFPGNTNSVSYNQISGEIITTPTLFIPVGNPANPFNATNQGARLRYIFGELDTTQSYTTDTQRYLVGVKGNNSGWDWDAALLYVGNATDATMKGFVNRPNLLAALNGQGGFGYYQPGIAGVNNNPGVYSFISPDLTYKAKSNDTQLDLKGSRDLMTMEGGSMALALGAGYRHEYLNNPGWGNIDGSIMNLGYNTISGSRNVYDAYAELFMPILKNLEVTAAVRFDHYSDAGSTTNPLIQAKWSVVPQLVLRGTFATGFRAPSPSENATSATTGFTSFVDPVRCPVTDAPTDCGAGQAAIISIGNPNLKPETSDTWTAGVVFEPFPGFSGTLDYWYIKTRNQILAPDPQAILNNPAAFPGTTIVRDPTTATPDLPGQVQAVFGPYTNIASVQTDGIDLDLLYRYNTTNYGRYSAELQWTHIFDFKRTLGGETIQYVDSHGPTSLSSSAGMPQDRVNVILGWTRGPWTATGTVRYVSPIPQTESRGISEANPCLQDITQPSCKAASFTTLDLSAAYTGLRNWTIYGSIINVFNRLAPFDPQAGYQIYNYNFNYAQSGAVGTQFNLGAKVCLAMSTGIGRDRRDVRSRRFSEEIALSVAGGTPPNAPRRRQSMANLQHLGASKTRKHHILLLVD